MKKSNANVRSRLRAATIKAMKKPRIQKSPATFNPAINSPLRPVLALALDAYVLDVEGIHGPSHWLRVLKNGRELARLTPGADLRVIEHFALLHDCCREDDDADPYHGDRAAEYVRQLEGKLQLTHPQLMALVDACAGHELGETTDDPTIGCCWDADRLELARLYRAPIDKFMSTSASLRPSIRAQAWSRGTNLTRESL